MYKQMNLDLQKDNEFFLVWCTTERWWTTPDPRDQDEDFFGMNEPRKVQQYEVKQALFAVVKSKFEFDRMVPNLSALIKKESETKGEWGNCEGKKISFQTEHARFADIEQFCGRAKEQLTLKPIYRTI